MYYVSFTTTYHTYFYNFTLGRYQKGKRNHHCLTKDYNKAMSILSLAQAAQHPNAKISIINARKY
jgi:hypothetical protein